MKKLKILLGILALIVIATPVLAKGDKAKSPKAEGGNSCLTIPGGQILAGDSSTPITTGYDQWGYNYQAHMFNGGYCDAYRDAAWCQEYKNINLIMKWNDAWLSNKSCDSDPFLDRHYEHESYIGSGAWETNHQSGEYDPMIVDEIDFGDT